MEPAAFPVRDLAPQTEKLGQGPEQRGCRRWAFPAIASLVLTGSFPWGVYQARHSRRDLAFVITVYYLIALVWCCLAKLSLLRRDDPAKASEWRRVRFAAWTASVVLAYTVEMCVAEAIPDRRLKNAAWWITSIGVWLAFYTSTSSSPVRTPDTRRKILSSKCTRSRGFEL
jgi:hypothetical protein